MIWFRTKPIHAIVFHIIMKGIDKSWFATSSLSQKKYVYSLHVYILFLLWFTLVYFLKVVYNLIDICFVYFFVTVIEVLEYRFFKFVDVIEMISRKNLHKFNHRGYYSCIFSYSLNPIDKIFESSIDFWKTNGKLNIIAEWTML